jgi:hypothetical protein
MPAAISLVTLILPQIPALVGDVEAIWTAIAGVRTAAQQTGEWTDAAEAAWQQALLADGRSPDWTPAQ